MDKNKLKTNITHNAVVRCTLQITVSPFGT